MDIATASVPGGIRDATIVSETAEFLPLPQAIDHRPRRRDVSTSALVAAIGSSDVESLPKLVRVPELIRGPRPSPAEARQRTLQVWLGSVGAIGKDEFIAILRDQTDPTRPNERVTIGVDEIDPEDMSLFSEGATFYWFIFEEIRKGARRFVSDLRFRRLPVWSKVELGEVKKRAAIRAQRFNANFPNATQGR